MPMRTQTMVARVVLPPGRPGSVGAGYANAARATTPEFSVSSGSGISPPMEMTDMENTSSTKTSEAAPSTLTLYRQLFNQLDLSTLDSTQLLDLAALSAEQAEGLCHGLSLFGELMQKHPQPDDIQWKQLNHYLNATAHLVPALCNLYGRALREMECQS
ncbi:ash family protein [Serratia sp. NA_112.1]|uniref:ash family protein n=1 Tax=unclassified Serratia (in: enterobacteria) TaxID=2647522 RepID=UPI004046A2E6